MPSIETATENAASREQLRTFHLTGRGLDAFAPELPLRPSLLEQLEWPRVAQGYPIYHSGSHPPGPFAQLLQADACLQDHVERIVGAFNEKIGPRGFASLASVAPDVEFLPAEAYAALQKALPAEGWLIGFGESAPLLLTCALLQSANREARQSFARQLDEFGERLRELLSVEDRKAEASPDLVAQSLGARAGSFLDPSALAGALRRRAASTRPMDAERRARCESALTSIREAMEDLEKRPSIVIVHSGPTPEALPDAAIQYEAAADACDTALSICRALIARYLPVWKALRIARLEVESAFDAFHMDALDAFDPCLAHADEIGSLPSILVFEASERIEQHLTSFSRLLHSGLPVRILIADRAAPRGNFGFHPLACQDAFLLRSSVAEPGHLTAGLVEMAKTPRTGAALVATAGSWTEACLLVFSHAVPLWRYHPDLGESWLQRFALTSQTTNDQLTFAHAAALLPSFRSQFRVLPDGANHSFPSLSVVDENNYERRAIFTREVAMLSASAQTGWRFLSELASARAVKEPDPEAGHRARLDGAREAVLRVISLLNNPG